MIVKTPAIALRLDPYSRTSQVVAWMTPDHGRVVTIAKGAKRRQSDHLGQYDVFYTCELLFYSNPRGTLHVLKECTPLVTREAFRSNWKACLGASYLADLLNRMTPFGTNHAALYSFAEGMFDFLNGHGISLTVMHWIELRLFRLLGVAPQLRACLSCGTTSPSVERPITFSIQRGGIVCRSCGTTRDALNLPLSHDVLAMLRAWSETDSPLIALRTVCSPAQNEAIDGLVAAFLQYHLESSSIARSIALEAM